MRHFRHHYYPRLRTAYGPRQGRAHAYVGEAESLSARDLAGLPQAEPEGEQVAEALGLRFVERAMPRGGVRLLVICPDCQRPCLHLYAGRAASMSPYPLACRRCVGLVYWRQYAGRRPEADVARAVACAGRYHGWQEALATWREREAQHAARAWVALTINQLRLGQMIAYHNQLDELYAAALQSVQQYRQVKRQSAHTATLLRLDLRIRDLRASLRQRHAA